MHSVEIRGLTKLFDGFTAVDGLSFSVEKGEIFGLLGPNGAGKTTTIRMLTTLLTPTSGTARINGFDITSNPMQVRESLGLIEQEVALEGRLSAFENLKFYARVYHVDSKKTDKRVWELLELVGLKERAHDLVNTYSGGMKRRLEIIKSILHDPRIVFMDEPTEGLDTQTRVKIWSYIKELCRKEKTTVFLTTHYIDEADFLCDRIAVIDHGKLVAIDTPRNLKRLIGGDFILDISVGEKGMAKLEKLVKNEPDIKHSLLRKNTMRIVSKHSMLLPKIITKAGVHGIEITHISMKEPSLEDVFIHLTGRDIRADKAESHELLGGGG
jgi:ABC-2 type transport system ATP-binding protein